MMILYNLLETCAVSLKKYILCNYYAICCLLRTAPNCTCMLCFIGHFEMSSLSVEIWFVCPLTHGMYHCSVCAVKRGVRA